MLVVFEMETNPGPDIWFSADLKVEHSRGLKRRWWGFGLSWCLTPPRTWQECRYGWDVESTDGWVSWKTCLLGFEVTFERRR